MENVVWIIISIIKIRIRIAKEINVATLGSLEATSICFIETQWNLKFAIDLAIRLVIARLQLAEPGFYPKSKLHVDTVNPSSSLLVESGNFD